MCQWGANMNPWADFQMGLSRRPLHTSLPTPKPRDRNLQPNSWRSNMSFESTKLAGCEIMPRTTVQLFQKPQMSERRRSTLCTVVEWPDHRSLSSLAPSRGTRSVGWCQAEGYRIGKSPPTQWALRSLRVVVVAVVIFLVQSKSFPCLAPST